METPFMYVVVIQRISLSHAECCDLFLIKMCAELLNF